MEGNFPFERYEGRVIKITAYGLKFLPPRRYKIIYSQRNLDEILDSMEKMAKIKDENREETREVFQKLNSMIIDLIRRRDDVEVLFVDYNRILSDPAASIAKIHAFLESPEFDLDKMIAAVDSTLYRKRRV